LRPRNRCQIGRNERPPPRLNVSDEKRKPIKAAKAALRHHTLLIARQRASMQRKKIGRGCAVNEHSLSVSFSAQHTLGSAPWCRWRPSADEQGPKFSNSTLLIGGSRFRASTKRKLTDCSLDVEFYTSHLRKQIDIGGPDRTSAEPHVIRCQVERLSEYADVLQKERICERAVLPRNPAKASSNGDQDLRRGGRVHCKFGSRQQRFE